MNTNHFVSKSNVNKVIFDAKVSSSNAEPVPVERVETAISNSRVKNRSFNPLNSYIKSDFQKKRYENSYALLKTKHNGFNEGECSPCFAQAANYTLVAIAVFHLL